jgi:hypothetical protein
MSFDISSTASLFLYNPRMADYLKATERGDIAAYAGPFQHNLTTDKGAEYDQVIEIVSLDHSLVNGLVLIFVHRNSPSWSLTSMALSRPISCNSHLQGGRRGREERPI